MNLLDLKKYCGGVWKSLSEERWNDTVLLSFFKKYHIKQSIYSVKFIIICVCIVITVITKYGELSPRCMKYLKKSAKTYAEITMNFDVTLSKCYSSVKRWPALSILII